jgi:hypothetical protein
MYSPYENMKELREAFWRTLVADTNPKTRNSPQSFFKTGKWASPRKLFMYDPNECPIYEEPFYTGLLNAASKRHFVQSTHGWIGLAPLKAQEKDSICIFLGGRVPFIIRLKAEGQYQFIRGCYAHGLMDGEAMNDLEVGKYRVEEIMLC